MEPRGVEIDSLLRRSMAGPVPSLPADFDQQVLRELRGGSRPLDRLRRIVLPCYGLVSVATSAVVMRGAGLEWGPIAALILAPVAIILAIPAARSAIVTGK